MTKIKWIIYSLFILLLAYSVKYLYRKNHKINKIKKKNHYYLIIIKDRDD